MNGPEDKPKFDFSQPPPPGREDEYFAELLRIGTEINREIGIDMSKEKPQADGEKYDTLCSGGDLT